MFKLNDILRKTKISVNGKQTMLLDLKIDFAYETDQSNTFEDEYEIKFEDHPRNNYAMGLLNHCREAIDDLREI